MAFLGGQKYCNRFFTKKKFRRDEVEAFALLECRVVVTYRRFGTIF